MQEANDDVTESEPNLFTRVKGLTFLVCCAIILAVASYYLYGIYQSKSSSCVLRTTGINPVTSCITFEKADSNAERIQGLSGRDSMPNNKAMMFVFDTPAKQCMWMKDMKFSLDIVWLNSAKKITKVTRNISPQTYPNSFCGGDRDLYVIELAPGVISDEQLKIGNQLNL